MDWIEAWNILELYLDKWHIIANDGTVGGQAEMALLAQIREEMSRLKMQVLFGGQP